MSEYPRWVSCPNCKAPSVALMREPTPGSSFACNRCNEFFDAEEWLAVKTEAVESGDPCRNCDGRMQLFDVTPFGPSYICRGCGAIFSEKGWDMPPPEEPQGEESIFASNHGSVFVETMTDGTTMLGLSKDPDPNNPPQLQIQITNRQAVGVADALARPFDEIVELQREIGELRAKLSEIRILTRRIKLLTEGDDNEDS